MTTLKHVKKFRELPPEAGVTYETKFATGWKFTVKEVTFKPGAKTQGVEDVMRINGFYTYKPENIVPINIDRLVLLKTNEVVDEHNECPHCGKIIDL